MRHLPISYPDSRMKLGSPFYAILVWLWLAVFWWSLKNSVLAVKPILYQSAYLAGIKTIIQTDNFPTFSVFSKINIKNGTIWNGLISNYPNSTLTGNNKHKFNTRHQLSIKLIFPHIKFKEYHCTSEPRRVEGSVKWKNFCN